MAAKKGKAKESAKPRGADTLKLLAVIAKGLLALVVIGLTVWGIVWLGQQAGVRVADEPRYTVPFAQINCTSPAGTDRLAFLTEVRYLAGLPDTLQTVEPGLAERLNQAFRKHPWVSTVEKVKIAPDATIQVELTFRTPVLRVRTTVEAEVRAVDRDGVLLPVSAPTDPLPELVNPVLAPTRPAGEVWDDPTIRRAAELVELYKPQKPTLIEKTSKGWRLTLAGGRVVVVSL